MSVELRTHLRDSTAVAVISSAAAAGFIAFARRTAEISPEFEPLTYTAAITAVLVSSYTAYAIFEVLKTYTERFYEIFTYLSGAVLIMSYMPIGHLTLDMPGVGMPEINVLGTLHALTAVFIISGIAKLELMRRK